MVPGGLKNWKISCLWQKCLKPGSNFETCPSVRTTTGCCTFRDETSSFLNTVVSVSSAANSSMWLKVVPATLLLGCF